MQIFIIPRVIPLHLHGNLKRILNIVLSIYDDMPVMICQWWYASDDIYQWRYDRSIPYYYLQSKIFHGRLFFDYSFFFRDLNSTSSTRNYSIPSPIDYLVGRWQRRLFQSLAIALLIVVLVSSFIISSHRRLLVSLHALPFSRWFRWRGSFAVPDSLRKNRFWRE